MNWTRWTTPRRGAIGLLIGALAFSATANIMLWKRVQDEAREGALRRLDPIGLRTFARDRERPRLPGTGLVVVVYGDSRAAVWPMPSLAGVTIVNRGIGGQSTEQLVARYAVDVAPLRPTTLVVQAGVNDLTTLPLLPDQRADIIRRCKANLARLVQLARADSADVVLTTIFPRGRSRWFARNSEIDAAIADVNAFITSLHHDRVFIVDTTPMLADAAGYVRPLLAADELHLNDAGYAAISPPVIAAVQELSLGRAR